MVAYTKEDEDEKNRKSPWGFLSSNCRCGLSISKQRGNFSIKSKLEEKTSSKILTNDLVKLAEFVLKNIFFEINNEVDT